MIGASNGRIPAAIRRHYPELDVFEALPPGEQEAFVQQLDAFLARRKTPLTEAERQLAFVVGRELWRRSMEHGWRVRGHEVRVGIEEGR